MVTDAEGDADETTDRSVAAVADALDGPVILFDGVCNLCNAAVRTVVRYDDRGVFRFAPLQSAVGQELLRRHDLPTADFDSVVLVEDGRVSTRSTAALRVCRRLGLPWSLLSPLLAVPAPLRDPFYDLVARVRYRVFGRTDECQVPSSEVRERFAERALDADQ
ncbi:MAG: thiol-disulfide oxidoreductase DCC family protein [Haloferacaceae archaeon]